MTRTTILAHNLVWCARVSFLVAFSAGVGSGCGPGRYIREIEGGHRYPSSVERLGDFPMNERARQVLLELLNDEDAPVRCTAVRALRNHLQYMPTIETPAALSKVVPLLEDKRVSGLSKPGGLPGSFLPAVDYFERLPSVRAEALLTLTIVLRCDVGFDQAAWRAAIADRFGHFPGEELRQGINKDGIPLGSWR